MELAVWGLGIPIRTQDGRSHAGYQTLTFNGTGMASGIYFVRASVPGKMTGDP